MRKVIVFISLLFLVVFVSSFSREEINAKSRLNFTTTISSVATEEESYLLEYNIPFIGNSFNGFREAVGFKESRGKYHVVNTLGYLGKYQFGYLSS